MDEFSIDQMEWIRNKADQGERWTIEILTPKKAI